MNNTTRSTVRIRHVLNNVECSVQADVTDTVDTDTGDHIYLCHITHIVDLHTGQMTAPKALPVQELRSLIRALQNEHPL